MKNLDTRIQALAKLGLKLSTQPEGLKQAILKSKAANPWFTIENCESAVNEITTNFLNEAKLSEWVSVYNIDNVVPQKVGFILAGNIPLVGFHDILCCFVSGNIAQIKLSDKDKYLLPYFLDELGEIDTEAKDFFEYVDRLSNPDAVVATGSNNSASQFEKYFGKYPNIIRRNRNAVSVLDGAETDDELMALGVDVFTYFGLGCRNVSKLYLPKDYKIDRLMEMLHNYNDIILHNKYKNNYDFNYAVYLLNKEKFFMNGALLLREHKDIVSRIACLHYESYDDKEKLEQELISRDNEIQCVSTKVKFENLKTVPLGAAQSPSLGEYADGVDTLNFLINL